MASFHFIVVSSHTYTVNVVYIKGAECVIMGFPIAGSCVLLRVLPCTVCLTSVGPSVHGLQIESCYNIIFVWLDTEVSVSYVCLCAWI